tara:strand:+ start:650 stop:1021 length:372 start_codon:yes stop_codon:yes gene_type:complete
MIKYIYYDINKHKYENENIIQINKIDKSFLCILKEYLNVYYLLEILLNIDDYKYKNIINYINHKWIKSQNVLELRFNNSKTKKNIKLTKNIDFYEFNKILLDFIDNDITTSIFVLNSILIYLF